MERWHTAGSKQVRFLEEGEGKSDSDSERERACVRARERKREREGTISVIRSVWQERWLSYLTDSHFDARGVEAEQGSDCIEVLALVEAGVVVEEEEWR